MGGHHNKKAALEIDLIKSRDINSDARKHATIVVLQLLFQQNVCDTCLQQMCYFTSANSSAGLCIQKAYGVRI